MSSVIFKAEVIPESNEGSEPCMGGTSGGLFRMGWFSVSGHGPATACGLPLPTNYEYVRSRLTQILCLQKNQDFDVCYKDAEGKKKLISHDEELRRAVTLLDDGLCKVYVCLKGPAMACG